MHLPGPGPVLVTGGDDHVASWVVGRFFEVGLDVHATAGDPDDPRETAKLNALARDSPGTLCFFRAGLTPPASGRHILVSESLTLIRIAVVLQERFVGDFPFSQRTIANVMVLMLAPMRVMPQAVARRNLCYPPGFGNGRLRAALGMTYRAAAESVVESFRQRLGNGPVIPPG